MLNELDLKTSDFDKKCSGKASGADEVDSEKLLDKCYDELQPYDECYIDYSDIPEADLQKNCEIYKSEKCQNYFKDPLKYVPTCSQAIGYRSVSQLNDMDTLIADLNAACKTQTVVENPVNSNPVNNPITSGNQTTTQGNLPVNDNTSDASATTTTAAMMLLSLLLMIINY